MRDVVSLCKEHGIPWCVWNYLSTPNDGNRFSLVDDDTRDFLTDELLLACLGQGDRADRGELKISGSSISGKACSLSTRMTDEDVPFGKVTIAAGRTLNIETGVTLSTFAGVAGGGSITSAADGGGLDVLAFGDTVAEIAGDVSVFSFVCTNGASEVEFAAGKTKIIAGRKPATTSERLHSALTWFITVPMMSQKLITKKPARTGKIGLIMASTSFTDLSPRP